MTSPADAAQKSFGMTSGVFERMVWMMPVGRADVLMLKIPMVKGL